MGTNEDYFGSLEKWSFLIGPIEGITLDDARKNAINYILRSVVLGPISIHDKTMCEYVSFSAKEDMILGLAISPPAPFPDSKKFAAMIH